MATPEGENIYDRQGTVLYRVVSAAQYEQELCNTNDTPGCNAEKSTGTTQGNNTATAAASEHGSAAAAATATSTAASAAAAATTSTGGKTGGTVCSVTARYGPQADLSALTLSKKFPARLAPLENPILQSAAASAAAQANTQQGITVVQALEKILPAQPFRTAAEANTTTITSSSSASASRLHQQQQQQQQGQHNATGANEENRGGSRGSSTRPASRAEETHSAQQSQAAALIDASSTPLAAQRRHKAAHETTTATAAAAGGAVRSTSPSLRAASRGPTFVTAASTERSSRLDVVLLLQHLQRRAVEENARPRGVLCAVRERIYDDALMELTRQVTLLCPERGLLMDELRKGMARANETYDVLFDNACQYAVRKSMERDLRSHLFQEKKMLESEVRRLDNRVNELRAKHDGMMKHFEEQKVATQKMHEEEIAYIKKANQQIVSEIKRLAALESANNNNNNGSGGNKPAHA